MFHPDSGKARIEDLVIGCAGGTIGVVAVVLARLYLARRREARSRVRVIAAGRPAPTTAAAAAPRIR